MKTISSILSFREPGGGLDTSASGIFLGFDFITCQHIIQFDFENSLYANLCLQEKYRLQKKQFPLDH